MEKQIEITEFENELIGLCKYSHEFGRKRPLQLFKAFYEKHYAVPYKGNEYVMFKNLYMVYMKIREQDHVEDLLDVFSASFYKGFVRNQQRPMHRAMMELYGKIQCTTVRDNGRERFVVKNKY